MTTIFKAKWQLLKRIKGRVAIAAGDWRARRTSVSVPGCQKSTKSKFKCPPRDWEVRGYGAFSLPQAKGNPFSRDLRIRRAFFGHREATSGFDPLPPTKGHISINVAKRERPTGPGQRQPIVTSGTLFQNAPRFFPFLCHLDKSLYPDPDVPQLHPGLPQLLLRKVSKAQEWKKDCPNIQDRDIQDAEKTQ